MDPSASGNESSGDLSINKAIAQTESPVSSSTALTLANNQTVLPAHIANLITALASSTRLTLAGVAFFIETILETSRFSTRISLGYTRKLLISAITSARRVYLLSNAALSGDVLTLLDFKARPVGQDGGDAFLQVLDRYTNLGIYVIHHTFTLAELFTMSSFYIAGSAVSSGLAAARESVGLLDSIFGSNESSRTLASIITLVSREVMLDESSEDKRGVIKTLGGLTKAMTAFAVLQNATWARTEKKIKMTIIHDCTVHSKRKDDKERSVKSGGMGVLEDSTDEGATAGPGPGTLAMRQAQSISPPRMPAINPLLDIGQAPTQSEQQDTVQELEDLADELEELMGQDGIIEVTDELTESTVLIQVLERVQAGRVSPRQSLEEEEWTEVDKVLTGKETTLNGPSPIRPISLKDATDHPRLHMVLKNMTRRIMKRRRFGNIQRDDTERDIQVASEAQCHTRQDDANHTPDSGNPLKITSTKRSSPFDASVRDRITTPSATPSHSDESGSPSGSSSSKRSSPFKALVQAKSAFARRLRFRRSPSNDDDVADSVVHGPGESARESTVKSRPIIPEVEETVHGPIQSQDDEMAEASVSDAELPKDEKPDLLFPHDTLISNIHRFMRYSSAAYGQHFLRILGLGTSEYNFPSTSQHHFNCWAFAQHTNLAIDSLLHSSHTDPGTCSSDDKTLPLVHYVSVDHSLKAIVLTCRGTLGLSDVLIDLTCDYQDISLEEGELDGRYYIHKGMYQSAIKLTSRQSDVHQGLVDALTSNPGYGLVVCGHSLGGGVAAAFAIVSSTPSSALRRDNKKSANPLTCEITTPFVTSVSSGLPPGRPIHAYAYGPPALASPDLTKYAEGLITSVVLNKDVVPCLSLGVLRDLKNIALTLREEDKVAEEIIGRVAGLYKRRLSHAAGIKGPASDQEAVLSDWLASLINTMRADMDNDKLYPPGCVYIMEYFEVFITQALSIAPIDGPVIRDKVHRAILRRCESVELRFQEPIFTKSMLHDHLPSEYERATQLLYDGTQDTNYTPP